MNPTPDLPPDPPEKVIPPEPCRTCFCDGTTKVLCWACDEMMCLACAPYEIEGEYFCCQACAEIWYNRAIEQARDKVKDANSDMERSMEGLAINLGISSKWLKEMMEIMQEKKTFMKGT